MAYPTVSGPYGLVPVNCLVALLTLALYASTKSQVAMALLSSMEML